MFGYILSFKNSIYVKDYEIQKFNVLCFSDANIFIVQNNKLLYKNNIVNNACKYGHVEVLTWFKHSGYEFKCVKHTLSIVCENNKMKILNWLYDNDFYVFYEECVIRVCELGNLKMLKWFKQKNFHFKNTDAFILAASKYGHEHVLEWFYENESKIKFNVKVIEEAALRGHMNVITWFIRKNILRSARMPYVVNKIRNAAYLNGHVQNLNFLKNNNYSITNENYNYFYFYERKMLAVRRGHLKILTWLKKNNYNIKINLNDINFIENFKLLKFYFINLKNKKKIIIGINRNIKKLIKYSKFLRFKTKKRYFKGYKKN